jgi:protein-S-isoprenylcysteine O-methyltransferase Ste14
MGRLDLVPRDLDSDPETTPEPTAGPGFLPATPGRREAESVFVRIIATAGVVGIGTLLGALLTANDVAGWIIGLVVSLVSVAIAGVLWRSRTL